MKEFKISSCESLNETLLNNQTERKELPMTEKDLQLTALQVNQLAEAEQGDMSSVLYWRTVAVLTEEQKEMFHQFLNEGA